MKKVLLIVGMATGLACRDASQPPGGPSFSVTADSGGACDAKNCHFNARDESASLNWYDPGTPTPPDTGGGYLQVFGYVSVSRGASGTLLYYGVTECRSWGCTTVLGGYGTIPNEDLAGNARSLHLSTNTSGNPNFFTYAGPTGTIDVTWTANNLFTYQSNGTTRTTQPGFSMQQTGQSDDASATASGTIVYYPVFPGNSGTISSSHRVSIVINH